MIIDEMFSTLLRMYRDPGMFGPIFEQNFRGVMKLLMGDKPGRSFTGTLLEFPKVYLSSAFRRHPASQIEDEQVKDFVAEAERVSFGGGKVENPAPYITNKFSRFLHGSLLGRVAGHGAMAFDFPDIIDRGKVIILKLARGRFGAAGGDLITAQIVHRFRWAAMARTKAKMSTNSEVWPRMPLGWLRSLLLPSPHKTFSNVPIGRGTSECTPTDSRPALLAFTTSSTGAHQTAITPHDSFNSAVSVGVLPVPSAISKQAGAANGSGHSKYDSENILYEIEFWATTVIAAKARQIAFCKPSTCSAGTKWLC